MNNFTRIGCAFVIGALVGGCATKYQDMGLLGGVAAEQVTSDLYRIKARGNGFTDKTAIQDYVLLKAAETTKAAGGTHFVLVSAEERKISMTATYTPGQTHTIVKPGQDAYVRVLTIKAGQTPPPNALAADEIIRFTGARVPRDRSA